MSSREIFENLYDNADRVLKAAQRVDYKAVLRNERAAVKALQEAVLTANLASDQLFGSRCNVQARAVNDGLMPYAHEPSSERIIRSERATDKVRSLSGQADAPVRKSSAAKQLSQKEQTIERRRSYIELINDAGYGGRIGKVYYAQSDFPVKPFKTVEHRTGLPEFDMVVAPDFVPGNGVQAIFISKISVFIAILHYPARQNQWRILDSKPYQGAHEMLELVANFIPKPPHLQEAF